MTAPSFDDIVIAWLFEYDDRIPTDPVERKEALIVLLKHLEKYGFSKEDLNNSRKDKIIKCCVNVNHRDKNKRDRWIKMVLKDLQTACHVVYGQVKIDKDIVTSEDKMKLEGMRRKAEETKSFSASSNNESAEDETDKPINLTEESFNLEEVSKPDYGMDKMPKTKEITDEDLGDSEGPIIVWDEDFLKKMESDNE